MDKNLSYVQTHFMSSSSLMEHSGIPAEMLAELTASRMLPRAAYFRNEHGKLTSNLGSTNTGLDDDYFHPAAIAQARHSAALLAAGAAPLAIAEALKSNFISDYMEHLMELRQFGLVEERVWQEHFADPESRRALAEREYGHWIAGTYALCTRDNTPQAVAVKECMVQNVDALTNKGARDNLSEDEIARLSKYLRLYDKVAALFAPFERPTSSGHRLRVTVAGQYGIEISS